MSLTSESIRHAAVQPARRESPSAWFVPAGLLILCLALRAIMAWRMPGICPDAVVYVVMGKAIVAGKSQPSLWQINFNVYTLIFAQLHRLGFSWETAGVAWSVVIASCTVLPLYGWIRRAFNHRLAIAAGILYAIHPGLIRWSAEIIRDSTFWFLLTLGLYLTWRAVSELRWAWYLAAGTAIALACLTRFEGFVLLFPLAAWSWRRLGEGKVISRRWAAAALLCASVYPLTLLLINAVWFHGRTVDLIRDEPLELAQNWAWEVISGQRVAENQNRADLLPPLPPWKMAGRFASGLYKGITPLYLVLMVVGIVTWRRPVGVAAFAGTLPLRTAAETSVAFRSAKDRDIRGAKGNNTTVIDSPVLRPGLQPQYRALACAAALILAAIWIHLYWSHEAGPRYFFPVVLMAAPIAGWGFLQISAAAANRVRGRFGPKTALLAGAAPLALLLAVNLSMAWNNDVQARAANVDLGHWVQVHYGRVRIFGPDGIAHVVNHYCGGACYAYPQATSTSAIVRTAQREEPNVVLLCTDCRQPPADDVSSCLVAVGFTTVDRARLPASCEKFQVLVRGVADKCVAVDSAGSFVVSGGVKPRS